MTQPEGSRDRGESEAARDLEALAFQRARAIAHAESNETLARNLRWYGARQEHTSHAAIARAEGRPQATIRTGVARARKFVLRVAHDLRYAQPAPLSGKHRPPLKLCVSSGSARTWKPWPRDSSERGARSARTRTG